ncbi:PfkB family carbohydrate kinase [Lentzea sp. NPDC051208]|uniref:PfkB family carbohydrate kinase n=1 Tax=Lentzea sp. NPDC051208 TaxID=3154642 RepID=UPI00341AB812
MFRHHGRPLLIGTVALDFLHEGPLGKGLPPATLRWGGVLNNVACALGARGREPVLITADYTGELRGAVAAHLAGNDVTWAPAPVRSPLPVFHAELVDGSVADMHFLGQEALDSLTPQVLGERLAAELTGASALVAATDGAVDTLAWLAEVAGDVPYWLLSADPREVGKLVPRGRRADLVALNLRELCLWADRGLTDDRAVEAAARELAGDAGHVVVTLGADGALVVGPDLVVRHSLPEALGDIVTVGAGDVHFACLLDARLAGLDWQTAMAHAAKHTTAYLNALQHNEHPYTSLRSAAEGAPSPL